MFEYFCYINTLGFIPYQPYFVIPLRFIMKLSPLPVVFSLEGFLRKSSVFLYFCISLLCH